MTNSQYQKRQDGDRMTFDVTPASCPRNKRVLYIAVPFFAIIAIGLLTTGIKGILGVLLVGGPIAYLAFYKDWRPVEHRAPSSFSVSPTEIEWKGRTFKKEDIHRLIIKNGMTTSEVAHAYVASGKASGSFAVGLQYRERIAAVTNALNVEAGGNAYALAGGMSETTAFGLMTDVNRVLGLQSS
jgi:hypothetical protein